MSRVHLLTSANLSDLFSQMLSSGVELGNQTSLNVAAIFQRRNKSQSVINDRNHSMLPKHISHVVSISTYAILLGNKI